MKKTRITKKPAVPSEDAEQSHPSVTSSLQPSDDDGSSETSKMKKSAIPVKEKTKRTAPLKSPAKQPAPSKSPRKKPASSISASKRIGSKSPARKRSRIPRKSSSDAGSTDDSQHCKTAASAPVSAPVCASVRTRPATHAAPAPSPSPNLSSDHPAASSPDRSAAPSPDHPAATLPNHLAASSPDRAAASARNVPSTAGRRNQEKLFLPANDEQDVAYWYRDNPLFYDQTLKEYKDAGRKMALLNEIDAKLSVPCNEFQRKTWLESMRTSAGKLMNRGHPELRREIPPTKKNGYVLILDSWWTTSPEFPSRQGSSILSKLIAKTKKTLRDLEESSTAAEESGNQDNFRFGHFHGCPLLPSN